MEIVICILMPFFSAFIVNGQDFFPPINEESTVGFTKNSIQFYNGARKKWFLISGHIHVAS